MGDGTDRDLDPRGRRWWTRTSRELHRGVGQEPVALHRVATTTCSDHVLPAVSTTATARNHVVDRLGRGETVLAAMPVASEDTTAAG